MCRISIKKINYISGIIFGMLLYLIIPIERQLFCFIPIVGISVVNILYMINANKKCDKNVIIVLVMIIYTVFLYFTTQYNQNHILRAWLTLLMISLISYNGVERISNIGENVIWFSSLLLLIYRVIVSPKMFGISPVFQTAFYDRIETELCVILFMYYAVKNKHISGVIYTVLYSLLLSNSRGTTLMLIVFFILRYGKKYVKQFLEKKEKVFQNTGLLFFLMIIFTFFYILFCYYWIYYVAVGEVAQHGQALNDNSNRTRFLATIYSVRELMANKNGYKLVLSGFGSNSLDVVGGDAGIYMGHRLKQCHNSVLSVFLCFGYIPGVLYLLILINIMSKNINYNNIEYIIGFVFYTFIIVIIAKKGMDAFWLYTLMIPEIENRANIKVDIPKIRLFRKYRC